MPFLRRRKSALIDGAAADARDLGDHLAAWLRRPRAERPDACAA
jgi:putative flavoprotein involved in K+ transport